MIQIVHSPRALDQLNFRTIKNLFNTEFLIMIFPPERNTAMYDHPRFYTEYYFVCVKNKHFIINLQLSKKKKSSIYLLGENEIQHKSVTI